MAGYKFALAITVLAVGGCGEDRTGRCSDQAALDMNRVLTAWDARDVRELLAIVNAADYMSPEDMSEAETTLAELRRSVGASGLQPEILVDGKPEDPRAYAIAHQVLTMERGCGTVSLVYDRNLKIVGFNIFAEPLAIPAAR